MILIIKQISILLKHNLSKYIMPFLNEYFIYLGEKVVQTCLVLCEKVIAPSYEIMK